MREIPSFSGSFRFLSNMYSGGGPIVYEDEEYRTSEHAYQTAKMISTENREAVNAERSPYRSKLVAQSIGESADWVIRKEEVMGEVVRLKFSKGILRDLLKATGDKPIIEGNHWNDTFWGVCKGEGKNLLGKLLMTVREENNLEDSTPVLETKQVLVIRRDLDMGPGKIAAQAAHAAMKVFFDRAKKQGEDSILIENVGPEEMDWVFGTFTKPVCYVKSEEKLLKLYDQAKALGIPVSLVTDIGKTVFNGVPTNTAIAVGPAEKSKVDQVTGKLRLL